MLETKSLLEALTESDAEDAYKNNNNDYDFREVLKVCSNSTVHHHEIRYSDGQIKTASFD